MIRWMILYVRQSSAHQVLHNRESSALQYAMRGRLYADFCNKICHNRKSAWVGVTSALPFNNEHSSLRLRCSVKRRRKLETGGSAGHKLPYVGSCILIRLISIALTSRSEACCDI